MARVSFVANQPHACGSQQIVVSTAAVAPIQGIAAENHSS